MKTVTDSAIKRKAGKRTRGYRLKPSTHTLIVRIQKLMKSDQDKAIADACNMLYAELRKNSNNKQLK